jgi:hypothetical protein
MATTLAPPPVQPGSPARKPRMSTRKRAAIVAGALVVLGGGIGVLAGLTSGHVTSHIAATAHQAPAAGQIQLDLISGLAVPGITVGVPVGNSGLAVPGVTVGIPVGVRS